MQIHACELVLHMCGANIGENVGSGAHPQRKWAWRDRASGGSAAAGKRRGGEMEKSGLVPLLLVYAQGALANSWCLYYAKVV